MPAPPNTAFQLGVRNAELRPKAPLPLFLHLTLPSQVTGKPILMPPNSHPHIVKKQNGAAGRNGPIHRPTTPVGGPLLSFSTAVASSQRDKAVTWAVSESQGDTHWEGPPPTPRTSMSQEVLVSLGVSGCGCAKGSPATSLDVPPWVCTRRVWARRGGFSKQTRAGQDISRSCYHQAAARVGRAVRADTPWLFAQRSLLEVL